MTEFPVLMRDEIGLNDLTANITEIPSRFADRLPTFDSRLDRYFDEHFEAIIAEWDLLNGSDLTALEIRINRITEEIDKVYSGSAALEKRVESLEDIIGNLEAVLRKSRGAA